MALFGALRRLAISAGQHSDVCTVAAPLSRAVHTLNTFSTAKFASPSQTDAEQPALTGVVPITGPLSAAW
jgi:hypothetical protein